jgi:ribonuclease-3
VPRAAHRALEKRLGYVFKAPDRLVEAMTHASAETRGADLSDNERLEFLGDRVLGLLTADALLKAYPDASEGELATRLNALVRRETLAEIAREIGLGACLVLSSGEDQSGGRAKPALLADACEALMAALYRDGGFKAAKAFFNTYWEERLAALDVAPRDAKTRLQEWAQAQGFGTPIYSQVSRSGPDHAPTFTIEVNVGELKSHRAIGPSKRDAEQAAAQSMLKAEGVDDE